MPEELETLRFFADNSTDILIKTDLSGQIYYCNCKSDFLLNKKTSDIKNIADFFNKNEAEKILHHINGQVPDTFIITHNFRYYVVYLLFQKNFAFLRLSDITEKAQLSEHLQNTYKRLNFAERTAKIGYWEFDIKNKKIFWSSEIFRIFGWEGKEVSHKKNIIKEQMLQEDIILYKAKLRELLRTGLPVEGLLRIRRKNDKIAHCLFKAGIIEDQQHKKIAGTLQDISQLIEIQQDLKLAKEKAEELNKAKSYFLAQASHDLRQPLQALLIFASALQEEDLNPEQKNLAEKIEAATISLKNLFDNLLDISKLETGGTKVHPVPFNICRMLKNIINEYDEMAAQKHIRLKLICRDEEILSDPILIERIVRNFLSNAFKYTKNKILVGLKRAGNYIQIRVYDNGVGIKQEEQHLVFNEFYQSKEIEGNIKNGSGLGLTIVKKIAKLINARIFLRSTPQKGSCFILELDKKIPHSQTNTRE